jgi:eukaryotic-like serine/threonine-protein kinase
MNSGLFVSTPTRVGCSVEDLRVSLSAKSFQVLLVLVRHSPETVSKELLLQEVWSDSFVEEANLAQHVSVLRKTLGETPQDRQYIVTVPGRGYRFVAEVKEIQPTARDGTPEATSTDPKPMEESTQATSLDLATPARAKIARFGRPGIIAVAALLTTAIIVVTWLHKRVQPKLGQKGSVLVADFENTTGEPVFDGALKDALEIELQQSPFLDIVVDDKTREALRLMGRSPDSRVLLPFARDLCQRVGAKALISGSVRRLGSSYIVSLQSLTCADGRILRREQREVSRKEKVLAAVGEAASRLRQTLGESLQSIQTFDAPIEQVTTRSLDALKAYSLGMEQRAKGNENGAILLFERAVELDSKFAMAYAQLGSAYANLGETEHAARYLQQAYSLRDYLSEREKLYLAVRYYTTVTGETGKATATYEMWSRLYPNDWMPFNGLAARYQIVGEYEKAATAAAQAIKLQPAYFLPYANLAMSYMALNRFDDAKRISEQANALHHDSVYTHTVLFELAFLNRDQQGMQRELDWARTTDREHDVLTTEAMSQLASRRLRDARQTFARSWAASEARGLHDDTAYSMAREALAEADLGNEKEAKLRAVDALHLGHGIDTEEVAAEALALSGDTASALRLAKELHDRFPNHTALNLASLPAILGAVEIRNGRPTTAIKILDRAAAYDFCEFATLSPVYIRAQGYLRMQDGDRAAAEFQKIIHHSGVAVLSQRHALALLGLARSLSLKSDFAPSKSTYEKFFAMWSNADGDIPELRKAKLEYSQLQSRVKYNASSMLR